MRILPFCTPKGGIAILAVLLFACLCAVPLKPFEIVSLTATVKAKAKNSPAPKTASFKADQTITFQGPSSKHLNDSPFQLSAVASSGLEVTFTAAGHCSVAGLTVHLTGVGSCTLTASQDGDDDFNAAPSLSRSFLIVSTGETVVDLNAFGALGDGVTNDSPALQLALDALADAHGGTLFVPPGHYALLTPVSKDFSALASVAIKGVESDVTVTGGTGTDLAVGLDLVSEFLPKTGETGMALSISGALKLLVADIAFVGTPDVDTDALVTLGVGNIAEATIRHCEFYGLRSFAEGGSIVQAHQSGLRIEQTKFLGSFGASGWYAPDVQNLEWKSITLTDVVFLDYGLRPELFCKCDYGASSAWVNIGNAAVTSADSPRREAVFQNIFLDEGALFGI